MEVAYILHRGIGNGNAPHASVPRTNTYLLYPVKCDSDGHTTECSPRDG
jgi:hypothetical protein